MPPLIFLTGGSGYIGTAITTHALSQGYAVHSLSRTPTSDTKILSLGATPIRGDLTCLPTLREQAQQADIVMHLADPMSTNYNMPYEERIRIDDAAVSALGDGLEGSNKPLVVTSGSMVVAATGAETDETSALWEKPLNERIVSERNNLRLCERGVRVSAVRLAPFVYGRGGSGVALFMRMFKGVGEVKVIREGEGVSTSAVHVEDAARLFLLAAEKARAGEVFNGCSEWGVTFGELGRAMAEVMGVGVGYVSLEEAVGTWGEFFARFLSTENRASGGKAMRVLGWRPERVGILEEVRKGSYVDLAESLKKGE
ncbi:NAD dependent epimerase/dehydratase [Aspergillus sclerotioniger CBS 115572]|uniref:NAD dependent epimerase/dehydratase n=1 Tax=Aspergillus sclerotioniger CBS 115572 TaxID=1450535 RepID=A0A317X2T5_9EURO|nr:NAD dependent epimerase/dehydratase [Aspergillus sclerotioniger CBS 115572]PWY91932.1 NAD dependent epimerase/dehydratase [Aspergillus sclerotioniger CBS 115572]